MLNGTEKVALLLSEGQSALNRPLFILGRIMLNDHIFKNNTKIKLYIYVDRHTRLRVEVKEQSTANTIGVFTPTWTPHINTG